MEQVYVLSMMGILGWFGGLLFDIFCIIAEQKKLKRKGLLVHDLIYCLIFTAVFLGCILLLNHGEIRSYVYLGLLVGFIIYFKWFHGLLWRFIWKIVEVFSRFLSGICSILSSPFRLVGYVLIKSWQKVKRMVKRSDTGDEISENQPNDEESIR